ncbi:MAG TPA: SRPBCC family protein [Opitutaceae bacterium]|nr:SRPBCC family protein [Opitutaceae bacterium]
MNAAPNPAENASDREIVISRVLHAPRELVWQAWTDPKHVANWWGPRGFTTTIKQMDFRVGGVWQHVMRGPDGRSYPNKSIFREIVPLERITFSHGGGREEGPGATFTATWTFEDVGGGRTRLTGRMVFPSKDARDFVIREFGAVEGGKQTLERAAEYVAGLRSRAFVIEREVGAPRDLVWKAWTERERLMAWFGPKGFVMNEARLELQPGGLFHYRMTAPDGAVLWGRFMFREIVPPTRLVWTNSFSDLQGGVVRPPFADTWPREILNVVTLGERAGRTLVTVTSLPFDATDEERGTFDQHHESMRQGWGGTLEQLESHLARPPGPPAR